jgi:hypothetical protein
MEAAGSALSALPPTLAHRIFALLPVDQRARSATVCRGWRALLADACLWTRLDFTEASGVTCRLSGEGLHAAAARWCCAGVATAWRAGAA